MLTLCMFMVAGVWHADAVGDRAGAAAVARALQGGG